MTRLTTPTGKTVKLLFFLLLFPALTGCGDSGGGTVPDKEDPDYTLSATPASLSFDAAGGTESITISSNTTWRINFNTTDWCKPSLQTSIGNASVIFTAEANPLEEERTLSLPITATGVDDVTISLTQAAKEPEVTDPDYIEPDQSNMSSLSAIDFSAQMGLGWNLGNSLESITVSGTNYSGNETSWGNPVVTQALIDAVKVAGFNTIRIPVSWSHMLENSSTYQIKSEWKERVAEVVNYALTNEMYVIINIHWDGGWMNHPDSGNKDAINGKLAALWKQIAIYFRDYDDHLLFAGTNEVHEEGDYSAPSSENTAVQNSFNQTFVNTVRATGGRNAYRYLVVQAYNTNIEYAVNYLEMPDDELQNRLFAEVHFYDPYDFSLQETDNYKTQWGEGYSDVSNWGQEDWVDETFGKMKSSFIDQDIPVILGEYGAILRTELNSGQEEHIAARNHYLNYVTQAALDNGLIPCYWDNGYTGNNSMGIFNRSTGEVVHTDALQAITSTDD